MLEKAYEKNELEYNFLIDRFSIRKKRKYAIGKITMIDESKNCLIEVER